jgi:hypothetical protein
MGYKMKGPTFFNKKKSPLLKEEEKKYRHVGGSDPVSAQAALDKTELDFREPGWSTAAQKIHAKFLNPLAGEEIPTTDQETTTEEPGSKKTVKTVEDIKEGQTKKISSSGGGTYEEYLEDEKKSDPDNIYGEPLAEEDWRALNMQNITGQL